MKKLLWIPPILSLTSIFLWAAFGITWWSMPTSDSREAALVFLHMMSIMMPAIYLIIEGCE